MTVVLRVEKRGLITDRYYMTVKFVDKAKALSFLDSRTEFAELSFDIFHRDSTKPVYSRTWNCIHETVGLAVNVSWKHGHKFIIAHETSNKPLENPTLEHPVRAVREPNLLWLDENGPFPALRPRVERRQPELNERAREYERIVQQMREQERERRARREVESLWYNEEPFPF